MLDELEKLKLLAKHRDLKQKELEHLLSLEHRVKLLLLIGGYL